MATGQWKGQTGSCDALLAPSQCLTQQNSPLMLTLTFLLIFLSILESLEFTCKAMNTCDLYFNGSLSIWWWLSSFSSTSAPRGSVILRGFGGGVLDFVWEICEGVLIHFFRNPVIEKHLKNVSYYYIIPHHSKYT